MTNTLKILTRKQVMAVVPYSQTHLWRLERAGQFPRRIKLGPNRVGWLESEINEWIESRLAERPETGALGGGVAA